MTPADKVRASGKADDEDGDGGESDNNEGEGNFELDLFAKSDVDDIHDLDVEFSMCDDIQNYEESVIPGAPEGWVTPKFPKLLKYLISWMWIIQMAGQISHSMPNSPRMANINGMPCLQERDLVL